MFEPYTDMSRLAAACFGNFCRHGIGATIEFTVSPGKLRIAHRGALGKCSDNLRKAPGQRMP